MELLKGKDLRQLLKEGWRPTPMESALIVRRAADALAYAHSKGVVHRDVKPANIFMTGRTQPKLLDFGLARVASQQDDANSGGADFAAGSPYYMAPEQVRHATVDRRGDVFSLGVVLYELLTGNRPFTGATLTEIATAVLGFTPPLAHEVNPAVPEALSKIAARAMEKEPENRFRSARALSRELRHWIAGQSDTVHQQDEIEVAQRRSLLRRWGGVGVAAGLLMLGLGILLGSGVYRRDSSPHAAEAVAGTSDTQAVVATSGVPDHAPNTDALPVGAPAQPADTVAAKAHGSPKASAGSGEATSTTRDARPRLARERKGRSPEAGAGAQAFATGQVNLAVSPWGHVEVDGKQAGTVPPVSKLTLSEGRHTITIRNDDFAPHTVTITVTPDQPITVRHKFGS
jgi:serine/threonine-protein kinase